jgi:hypothetical protein
MTDQQLAPQAINEAQLILEDYLRPRPQNHERILDRLVEVLERPDLAVAVSRSQRQSSLAVRKMSKLPSIALTAWIVTLLSVAIPNAQAKQQCSAAPPKNPHGQWWSYRLIDGRNCWYEGKPMLSKSLLEWPKEASAQPVSNGKVTSVVTQKSGNPLDAQARTLNDPDTFEARWRERVDMR